MSAHDELTIANLGCRGVLRLCWRALYCQFCECASVPFLTVCQFSYGRIARPLIFRFRASEQAHHDALICFGWLDTHCPLWLLQFVHDIAWGWRYRQIRLERRHDGR